MLCASVWPPMIEQWRELIETVARRNGLDPSLLAAIVQVESGGDRDAVRCEDWLGVCSYGLMQIVDFDWRRLTLEQLLDPDFNVDMGTFILSESIRQGGSIRRGLAVYNCGLEGVRTNRCGKHGGYAYADKALRLCREYGGCVPPTIGRHFVQ